MAALRVISGIAVINFRPVSWSIFVRIIMSSILCKTSKTCPVLAPSRTRTGSVLIWLAALSLAPLAASTVSLTALCSSGDSPEKPGMSVNSTIVFNLTMFVKY